MRTLLFVVLALASIVPAMAATTPPKPVRLGLCAACHGDTGNAQMAGAPNLAGQRLDYLRTALKHYRDGSRDVPLMRAAIGPISDAELDELARWYSVQIPRPESSQP